MFLQYQLQLWTAYTIYFDSLNDVLLFLIPLYRLLTAQRLIILLTLMMAFSQIPTVSRNNGPNQ